MHTTVVVTVTVTVTVAVVVVAVVLVFLLILVDSYLSICLLAFLLPLVPHFPSTYAKTHETTSEEVQGCQERRPEHGILQGTRPKGKDSIIFHPWTPKP